MTAEQMDIFNRDIQAQIEQAPDDRSKLQTGTDQVRGE